jgi:hypothetical protein
MLDVLQLDTAACAIVLERASNLTQMQFYDLAIDDALALMAEIVGFLGQTTAESPSPSKMPGS